jgi:hypothetical protein
MEDLLKAYFERDLNARELAEVERLLDGSEEYAGRFAKQAARYYARLGLPRPKPPADDMRAPKPWLWGLAGLLMGTVLGGLGMWAYVYGMDHPAPLPAPVQREGLVKAPAPRTPPTSIQRKAPSR